MRWHSIRVKILAPFLVSSLALGVFLSWYTHFSVSGAAESAALDTAESMNRQVVTSMQLLMAGTLSSVQNLVDDPHVTSLLDADAPGGTFDESCGWLETICLGNEYYRDILVLDRNGVCLASLAMPGMWAVSTGVWGSWRRPCRAGSARASSPLGE